MSQGLELVRDLEEAGALSAIGLHLSDPDLPYERFEDLCVFLGKVHEMVRFAIGDAILLAEKLYGEKGYQAIELIGLSENARLEYVRVAQRVPRSTRRKDLSWSHHRAVAALPPKEQKTWLREASEARQTRPQRLWVPGAVLPHGPRPIRRPNAPDGQDEACPSHWHQERAPGRRGAPAPPASAPGASC